MILNRFPEKERYLRLAEKYRVVPVCTQILADTLTPVSLLGRFYEGKGPIFLLESVEGGERWARYSFLGFSAHLMVRVFADRVEVEEAGSSRSIAHNGKPFQVLRELLTPYRPADVFGLPRFWGGLVGHLNYEMVSFIEAIPHQWPVDQPLACFMVPETVLIFDNVRHTLLLAALTFPNGNPEHDWTDAGERLERILEKTAAPMPRPPVNANGRPELKSPVDPEIFRSRISAIKDHIRAGDVIQTVFSQPFISDQIPDAWRLYRAMRYINPSPYMFFLHLDDTVLVGSSPETMVRLENGIATLRPIAGTRPRGRTEQEDRQLADDLLKDEKERAEHLMLVDLGRNDLGRVAEIGSVQVTDLMVVERYSHVMHLVSNIRCDLRSGLDAWDLLAATFPAGTLSGAPKVRAMGIIAAMEDRPRGPYGGAVGYLSFSGNMDMAITIRTAYIADGELTVQAGAGVVADSDPERERMETVNKAMAFQKALQLTAQGSVEKVCVIQEAGVVVGT
jgi:anthranilate synthase component 1